MQCDPCLRGEFQDEIGQQFCKRCDLGLYQDEEGGPTCKECLGKDPLDSHTACAKRPQHPQHSLMITYDKCLTKTKPFTQTARGMCEAPFQGVRQTVERFKRGPSPSRIVVAKKVTLTWPLKKANGGFIVDHLHQWVGCQRYHTTSLWTVVVRCCDCFVAATASWTRFSMVL